VGEVKIKRELFMEASEHDWEDRAVLNPSVVKTKDGVEHIFYRAVAKKWISCIGYARVVNGKVERFDKPLIKPTRRYESKGIEDPRVTKIGGVYYMLYTAFDGRDARIAYAVSKDLKKWEKKGVISPGISVAEARKLVKIKKYRDRWKHQEIEGSRISLWDKDAVLFPEKIDGKFVMLHRFLPDIQIVKFRSFSELKKHSFWEKYVEDLSEGEDKVSLYRRYDWEGEHIGAGATPIKTKKGWLLIYHAVELRDKLLPLNLWSRFLFWFEGKFHKLRMLDLKKPEKEIGRMKCPLFSPKYDWEKKGDVNNVVFPEGALIEGNKLKIYYGCADSRIGLATLSLGEVMKGLGKSK
jgi:predicted GH43/DUF377 family glycosyl hydrolase